MKLDKFEFSYKHVILTNYFFKERDPSKDKFLQIRINDPLTMLKKRLLTF